MDDAYWLSLARHEPLGILTDLDGTLIPFAASPEAARPTPEISALVRDLSSLPGVTVVIASGRPRETLDEYFPRPRSLLLVAEHGAWRSAGDDWESMLSLDERAIDSLATELRALQTKYTNAILERKTWSLAFHYRRVAAHEKMGLLVQVSAVVDAWLSAHPDFEQLAGAEVLEIRPRMAKKANAVDWARARLGPRARLLVVGDDVTDEDMFSATADDDASVLVGAEPSRVTAARWRFGSPEDVHAFFRWIVELRGEPEPSKPSRRPSRVESVTEVGRPQTFDLLVLSNRLPELRSADESVPARKRNVGGLVSALGPVLTDRRGIWLGWSGRARPEATATEVGLDVVDGLSLAWVDFPDAWHRHYYNGFSNSLLWPLLHSFPTRIKISHQDWHSYERANEAFATVAMKLVAPKATIWAHDYHLLLLGKFLRARGHTGPLGLFQHIPFPGPDIFFLLPWASEILEAMLAFDLVGFHTRAYKENFLHCMAQLPGVRIEGDDAIRGGERRVRAGAFPLGIIPEQFQAAGDASANEDLLGLFRAVGSARMVLGVDRLDYTKGIPERIAAFGGLLETFPKWRRNVCLVQVSVPSRADISDYAEQRSRVENIVGRINGEYGEGDWVPIRYLYRSYGRSQLSQLYRAADVGYVTPLRDGMNLVAKEFVAAQDAEKPGVLLLSRFAGAAEELTAALLTNPWDAEGTAIDLNAALEMPLDERRARHASLMEVISRTTALTWAQEFLVALGFAAQSG